MIESKKSISILELKRLLYDLYDKQSYTCIRFRFLGALWQKSFWQIFNIDEREILLYDETLKGLVRITNLVDIIQFEIDHNFQSYQAHFHYDVVVDEQYVLQQSVR